MELQQLVWLTCLAFLCHTVEALPLSSLRQHNPRQRDCTVSPTDWKQEALNTGPDLDSGGETNVPWAPRLWVFTREESRERIKNIAEEIDWFRTKTGAVSFTAGVSGATLCPGLVGSHGAWVALQDGNSPYEPLFFVTEMLPPATTGAVGTAVGTGTLTLVYGCHGDKEQHCITITARDTSSSYDTHRVTRAADDPQPHTPGSSGITAIVMGGIAVLVGVVGLAAAMFLCGHSSQGFDPQKTDLVAMAPGDKGTVVASSQSTEENGKLLGERRREPEPPPVLHEPREAGEALTPHPPTEAGEPLPVALTNSGSVHQKDVSSQGTEQQSRQQGQEPLPDDIRVPKVSISFEEGEAVQGNVPPEVFVGEKDEDDEEEDEGGYTYARVSGEHEDVKESSSEEEEEEDSPRNRPPAKLPPYGLITRPKAATIAATHLDESESYAEVREINRTPQFRERRFRSATDPLEPASGLEYRDRALTAESAAKLPLPAIPGVRTNDDKIPDNMEAAVVSPPKPLVLKERLYESMDELEDSPEDTYETVPDEIKLIASPLVVPSTVVFPPPSPKISLPTSPPPPASPIPKRIDKKEKGREKEARKEEKGRDKEARKEEKEREKEARKEEKKKLSKTVSDSDNRKRSFSLFNRKKQPSTSAAVKAKEVAQLLHGPLPDIPTGAQHSPHQLTPPPPPILPPPIPPGERDEVEDVMYDTADLLPQATSRIAEAKMKSMSLPSPLRSAGTSGYTSRPHLPLPDLPEDSGSGIIVCRKPILDDEDEMDPSYDVVVHGRKDEEEDDPNYETVNREELLRAAEEAEGGVDPGYDKVGHMVGREDDEGQNVEEGREAREGTPKDLGYGKVTKPPGTEPGDGDQPEHDELGYAVIPAEARMRKRTMSASKQKPTRPAGRAEKGHKYDSARPLESGAMAEGRVVSPGSPNTPSPPPRTAGLLAMAVEEEDPYSRINPDTKGTAEKSPNKGASPPSDEYDPYARIDADMKIEALASELEGAPVLSDDYDPYSKIDPSTGDTEGALGSPLPSPGAPESPEEYDPYSKISGGDGSTPETEDPYAKIDLEAKRELQQMAVQADPSTVNRDIITPSPVPPPLPPAMNISDLDEFIEPPIPTQSAGVHELLPNPEEPQYSSVVKHPKRFLESNEDGDDEHPYASVTKVISDGTEDWDDALGYDTVGEKVVAKHQVDDKALGYDTIGAEATVKYPASHHPPLASSAPAHKPDSGSLTELVQPYYDSLGPNGAEGLYQHSVDEETRPLYDSLLPVDEQEEDEDEQRYEEIDEDMRLKLLARHMEHTSL